MEKSRVGIVIEAFIVPANIRYELKSFTHKFENVFLENTVTYFIRSKVKFCIVIVWIYIDYYCVRVYSGGRCRFPNTI